MGAFVFYCQRCNSWICEGIEDDLIPSQSYITITNADLRLEVVILDAGQGLDFFRHHLQYEHKLMLRRGPNGMRPLELQAEMQVKDWNRTSSLAVPA